MEEKIIYKELSYKINGLLFKVHITPKRVVNKYYKEKIFA